MAVDNIKSTAITNDTATPRVANQAGVDAAGEIKFIDAFITTVASGSQHSTYAFFSLPSTAKVKRVTWESEALGGGTIDVGIYRSDLAYLQANAVDQDFFASAIAVTNAVTPTDITAESGVYTLNKRKMPLWEAVGLTSDPRVPLTVVATVASAITNAARIGCRVEYTN